MTEEKPMTAREAAKHFGVHYITIYRWMRDGIIPDRRLPGQRKARIYASDLVREVTK